MTRWFRLLFALVLTVLITLSASSARAFVLIELPVVITKVWGYPLHRLYSSSALVGAQELERFGEAVLIYKSPGVTRVPMSGMVTPVPNWQTFSGALDFVASDYSMGSNPAFFSRQVTNYTTQNPLWNANDYAAGIQVACDPFDYASVMGNLLTTTTTMEVLHNTADNYNVLVWDQRSHIMGIVTSPVNNCFDDALIHSFGSDITAATGLASADIAALSEDRSTFDGKFYAFDMVSGHILVGHQSNATYTIAVTKAQIMAVTGAANVNLTGALTTDPTGNLYAWDRVSQSLIMRRASDGMLFKLLKGDTIKKFTQIATVNVRDIDFIVKQSDVLPASAVALLEADSGSVFLYFRP